MEGEPTRRSGNYRHPNMVQVVQVAMTCSKDAKGVSTENRRRRRPRNKWLQAVTAEDLSRVGVQGHT